ncbi:beta-glucosidase [Kribbella orskensis]|uniref:beta-glucosidase n=1 Tax=Kribbella orskensis TaxID=2512216 RepID=A0ABY2BFC7_9ACTN|nr:MULTISPECIES: glycoside hydrolase family 3 protein [Kribbella]TCN37722.1 beta-glucosidase [Kribbella sp. VKM Ac-2500]TCO18776.1 beta-glucosidase [Kribbella orskensis]
MRLSESPRRSWARRTTFAVVPIALVLALAPTSSVGVAPAPTTTSYATDQSARPQIRNSGQAYLDAKLPVGKRVEDLLGRMTLEEKVGQMTQAERGAAANDPLLVTTWRLGSVLSGGGSVPTPNTPQAWADMVDGFQAQALQTRLQIPIVYGVDSVHGHGNLLGATVFPHNIGLGSTGDPKLVERIEHVVAEETRATGPQWAFAPCICVARDTRWGRTYESFSESPELVTRFASAIEGFQGKHTKDLKAADRVLASAKHYAGDGDTEFGSAAGDYTIDQGVTVTNRRDFARFDLAPYVDAVQRYDTGTVMPSFSSIDWTEDGIGNPIKMHANRELITDVLKGKLGFDGFVISDWEGIHQLPGDYANQVRTGVNAGTDMFMEPFSYQAFETTLLAEVRAGRVSQARIDDAVRRILTKKFELGLFEKPYTDRTHLAQVGSPQHRALAREAVAKSQVLLKNAGGLLPLKKNAKVYVAGRNADDIGNQAGGWTLSWQGASGQHRIPGNTILDGIRQVAPGAQVTYSKDGSAPTTGSDVAVVVVGETPYSEGFGDVGGPSWGFDPEDGGVLREPKSLDLQPGDKAVVDKVCGAIAKCAVLVVSGRPQVIPAEQLGKIDALVASWLPGSQGEGVADVLFGKRPFTGKLSHSWPRSADQEPINIGDRNYDPLYPFGWGLRTHGH